jgi:hypothetical protein
MQQVIKPAAKAHTTNVQIASGLAGTLQAANKGDGFPQRLFTRVDLPNRQFATQVGLGKQALAR